jgi:hypothetical protein
MTRNTHPLVEDYLGRLRAAARVLPEPDRGELLAEIEGHIAAGLAVAGAPAAAGAAADDAAVQRLLDSLGDPAAIVAAARREYPTGDTSGVGGRDLAALAFLLVGFPPFIGSIIGIVLLCMSKVWTVGEKLAGAVVAGGLLPIMLLFLRIKADWRPSGFGFLFVTSVLARVPVLIYLYVVASRRARV